MKGLDVSPRDSGDYYRIGLWLVSKRLAVLATMIVCIASLLILIGSFPVLSARAKKGVPVFRYNSLPLKFYSGKAQILARSGYTAYIGQVEKGAASGKGTLYSKDGTALYRGGFSGSLYHGKGKQYRKNGTKEYDGQFEYGIKQGKGKLYNAVEELVYSGDFRNDSICYEKLAGIPTQDVAGQYTGSMILYEQNQKIWAVMKDIRAIYCADSEEDNLDGQWTTRGIYVLEDRFKAPDGAITAVSELEEYFGAPKYQGRTSLELGDVIAMKHLKPEIRERYSAKAEIVTEGKWKDAKSVTGYSRDVEGYIYTFEKDGFRYTFFADSKKGRFGFYLIECKD